MKYVFTENTQEAHEAEDAVVELEYNDLLTKLDKTDFDCTKTVKARSFASLQLRAKNAIKALDRNSKTNVLLLCGCSKVNTIELAYNLVKENTSSSAKVSYAPSKKELFGDDKTEGLLSKSNFLILQISHIVDHTKWLNKLAESLSVNSGLKLILCGDATDCANLEILWPTVETALRADIVMEFPIVGGVALMSALVKNYVNLHTLKDFDKDAILILCVWACRQSGDRRWLGIPEIKLNSLVIDANHYAKGELVTSKNVLKAIGADDFRLNYLAESELRNHRDEQILLATEGEVTGQINGLSVIETTGTSYEYGEPVRITATLRAGGDGDVIDIERKAELAGQIHAKAMMIINGFLSNEFGSVQPIPVTASLVFEQSYSEIDGDSASLTGLCAVISSFSDLPIRQDLAVTGAVDQFGDVQPVGGVNEKIEGFFKICRLNGLTGTQGVIIPCSCVHQLVLRSSVMKAVKDGKFHIYVVGHVTGAAKVLLKTPWGDGETPDSICFKICERLDEIAADKVARPWWKFF